MLQVHSFKDTRLKIKIKENAENHDSSLVFKAVAFAKKTTDFPSKTFSMPWESRWSHWHYLELLLIAPITSEFRISRRWGHRTVVCCPKECGDITCD